MTIRRATKRESRPNEGRSPGLTRDGAGCGKPEQARGVRRHGWSNRITPRPPIRGGNGQGTSTGREQQVDRRGISIPTRSGLGLNRTCKKP